MIKGRVGENTRFYEPHLSNIGRCVIGKRCTVHSHVWIADGVVIGDDVRIQAFVFIPLGVTINNNVFIGPRVTFTNDPKMEMSMSQWASTLVRSGARIGAGAIINAGVTIGENAIIGAGAVVLESVPDGETWVGNPARPVKRKKAALYYQEA